MEEHKSQQSHGTESATKEHVGSRGLFDCFGKKHYEEITEDAMVKTDFETVPVMVENEEKHTLMDELQCSRSKSSPSSDDEDEGGEKKRKKTKGLEKIKENLSDGNVEDAVVLNEQKQVPSPKVEEQYGEVTMEEAEKKGFLEKIKDKLPGHQKKHEDGHGDEEFSPDGEVNEKKGILEMIKEKLPGNRKTDEDRMKEKKN